MSAAGRLSPQLDGLGDVAGADLFAGGKVGDGARDLLDAVEGARREAEPGSGLGLYFTKALVEANRARLSLASEPRKGTLAEITFPTTRVLAE